MCTTRTKKYQSVEIPVLEGASQKIMIGDRPELRATSTQRVAIKGIEVVTAAVSPTTPLGDTTAPLTELKKASLVLNVGGLESIFQIPLLKLNRVNDGTSPYSPNPVQFEDLPDVNWSKSYIQFSSAPVGPYSFLLGVDYVTY